MLLRIIILSLILFSIPKGHAQCQKECPAGLDEKGWCWGDDPGVAKEKNALYNDEIKAERYEDAVEPLEWLLTNRPQLKKAIYINGIKIYKALLKKEKDSEKKKNYQDKILALYDKRICYFGEEGKVLNMKGTLALPYIMKRAKENKTLYDSLFVLYDKIFNLNRNKKMYSGNVVYYLTVASIKYKNLKSLEEDKFLNIFDNISEELDFQIENAKDDKMKQYWIDCRDKCDQKLFNAIKINCEFIEKKWTSDIENNNVKRSKQAMLFMIKDTCTDNPLYVKAATNIFNDKPTFPLSRIITKFYLKVDDHDQAFEWYEKSLPLIDKDSIQEKFQVYMGMAKLKGTAKNKVQARSLALEAVKVHPNDAGEAYEFIGDLYFSSAKTCLGKNPVEDRFAYLIAYDMYNKAGNAKKQKQAAQQFPSTTDIFTHGYQEQKDKSVRIACWINGNTILRGRSTK